MRCLDRRLLCSTALATVVVLSAGDKSLTLHYAFLKNSGDTIADAVLKGPVPAKTIASNAMSFDSAGNLAYAPHQLLENANWGARTGDLPSGWTWAPESGSIVWADIDNYSEGTFSATNAGQILSNVVNAVIAAETFTAVAYIKEVTGTVGGQVIKAGSTSGTDGFMQASDFTTEGWYATGFTMGAADSSITLTYGIGIGENTTGTVIMSRPSILKGLLPGISVGSTGVRLDGPPLGRWIGTDDGDEPLYDQPRFVHDPADSNAQLGLQFEAVARTNLGKQTSNLAGDQWTAINSDVPTENNTDIFGGTTADELAATSTADQQVARHQSYTGLTANVDTGVAAYVKTGTNAAFVQLAWDSDGSGGDGCFCNFQLTGAGTKGTVTAMPAGTATSANIRLTTEGFYRCVVVGKIASGTVGRFTINIVDRIDAVKFEAADLTDNDSLIVNAIDVQVGTRMLSHIPNAGGSGTSVTRAKDVMSVNVSSIYATGAGSTYAKYYLELLGNLNGRIIGTDGDGEVTYLSIGGGVPAKLTFYDGVSTLVTGDTMSLDVVTQAAATWNSDGRSSVLNGGTVATTEDVNISNMDSVTTFHFGANNSGGNTLSQIWYQEIKYWNVRKSDTFIDAETT